MLSMRVSGAAVLAVTAVALGLAPPAAAQKGGVVVGSMCDLGNATQTMGAVLCAGVSDYAALVNARGGIEGRMLRVIGIDGDHKAPRAIESYERVRKEGAVSVLLHDTPYAAALSARLAEDRIPGTTPGFGTPASADGRRYPYLFPTAATYWSQGAAAVKFAKDRLNGNLRGKKIAYLFHDSPAGREPLAILEDLAGMEGFELRTFAVPAAGGEMRSPVVEIARYRADFAITQLFGQAPSVSIREFKRAGFALSRVIALAWGSSEADIAAAGGGAVAEGYNTIQFAGAGTDYQVLKDIAGMYRKQGKEPPAEMASTVYYNRGVYGMALHVLAIRNALGARPDGTITGEDVKNGMEKIRGVTLGGLMPPLELTPADHEGGGWVQIFSVRGGKLTKSTDWFRAYPDAIKKRVAADARRK